MLTRVHSIHAILIQRRKLFGDHRHHAATIHRGYAPQVHRRHTRGQRCNPTEHPAAAAANPVTTRSVIDNSPVTTRSRIDNSPAPAGSTRISTGPTRADDNTPTATTATSAVTHITARPGEHPLAGHAFNQARRYANSAARHAGRANANAAPAARTTRTDPVNFAQAGRANAAPAARTTQTDPVNSAQAGGGTNPTTKHPISTDARNPKHRPTAGPQQTRLRKQDRNGPKRQTHTEPAAIHTAQLKCNLPSYPRTSRRNHKQYI